MVRISYITVTARGNYPHVGRPDLHLFDVTLDTLSRQSFKDFEYIIVDCFYEERKDYFKSHNLGLRIKHVPSYPNPWKEKGLVQVCHQFNKGVIHADGELLFFDADSSMLPPDLMANLWRHYKDGWLVSLGFGVDATYATDLLSRRLSEDGVYQSVKSWQGVDLNYTDGIIVPTEYYKHLGYEGKVLMDHRYRKLFSEAGREMEMIPPDWYYGISTASMDAILKVNGFDQAFDGDSALNDVDLGNRLHMIGCKLAMFRDCYVVEAYAGVEWHPDMMKPRPEIKCNYAMLLYNKLFGRYRVNVDLHNPDILVSEICRKRCNIVDQCRNLPHRGPFFNKNQPELYEYWIKYGRTSRIDLELERELRLDGELEEGTYVNL